ncbi:hypothetical protein [Laceyella putida]|uniref:Uncharacterized protein n=1 Tax=Laceyella putida TaxID=110101 RepID=A0ABW2RKQ6_9BACL
MKSQAEKWIVAAALAVALPTLLPIFKKTAGPLINQGSQWIKHTGKQAKILSVKLRHELEDIWLEAQVERMQKNRSRKSSSQLYI